MKEHHIQCMKKKLLTGLYNIIIQLNVFFHNEIVPFILFLSFIRKLTLAKKGKSLVVLFDDTILSSYVADLINDTKK